MKLKQTILPLLNNDFVEIIENCVNGTLKKLKLEWNALRSICIVIASKGYPDSFDKNILIENLYGKDLSFIKEGKLIGISSDEIKSDDVKTGLGLLGERELLGQRGLQYPPPPIDQ